MEIYSEGDRIFFKSVKSKKLGYTDYTKELWDKISSVNWHINGEYIYSSKLKMYLHRFVMAHWYGEDILKQSKESGFIVEHHDNDGFNCLISNLSFAPEPVNKAKAYTYDKDRIKMMRDVAINFYKDFSTGQYQITVAFNKETLYWIPEKKTFVDIVKMSLLYDDDFIRTFQDASSILHEMELYKKLDLSKLRFKKMEYQEAIHIPITSDNKDDIFFEHDGKIAIRLGTDKAYINQVPPNKRLYEE
ncbi:hypothetical protein [Cytobacillus praedii]|uniref:hypothetical protein n=1 Tax=Cytobacillus praedii TaxID=1742358 RepID=UPI002E1CE678|nr:hypothetical protein [Cytobacillus praedii]